MPLCAVSSVYLAAAVQQAGPAVWHKVREVDREKSGKGWLRAVHGQSNKHNLHKTGIAFHLRRTFCVDRGEGGDIIVLNGSME